MHNLQWRHKHTHAHAHTCIHLCIHLQFLYPCTCVHCVRRCCCCCTTFLRLFYISHKLQAVVHSRATQSVRINNNNNVNVCVTDMRTASDRSCVRSRILCTFYRLKSICVKQFVWWQSIQYWQVRHCRCACSIRKIASVRNWFTYILNVCTVHTNTCILNDGKAIHKRIVKFGIRSKSMIPRIRSINNNSSNGGCGAVMMAAVALAGYFCAQERRGEWCSVYVICALQIIMVFKSLWHMHLILDNASCEQTL